MVIFALILLYCSCFMELITAPLSIGRTRKINGSDLALTIFENSVEAGLVAIVWSQSTYAHSTIFASVMWATNLIYVLRAFGLHGRHVKNSVPSAMFHVLVVAAYIVFLSIIAFAS